MIERSSHTHTHTHTHTHPHTHPHTHTKREREREREREKEVRRVNTREGIGDRRREVECISVRVNESCETTTFLACGSDRVARIHNK